MKDKPLDSQTPVWFRIWHAEFFKPSDARSKRNEKWLYIIITAILGTSILSDKYGTELLALLKAFIG